MEKSPTTNLANALYNCDCLTLAERIPDETVDLIYLDPPSPVLSRIITDEDSDNHSDHMSVYHKFLANRLYQFHRILKQSGNIFVHINVHLSVSVNYIISRIFGNENFRNQYIFPSPVRIVGSPSPDYSVILFYSKSKKFSYNQLTSSPDQEDSIRFFPYKDDRGNYQLKSLIHNLGRKSYKFDWKGITPQKGYSWRYGPEQLDKFFSDGLIDFGLSHNLPALKLYSTPGVPIGSIWNDLDTHFEKDEIVGFPTQKSEKLLARIIKIGTNENNTVFDPFCGSSTTLVASQKLRRKWIGCDISSDACRLSLERLENKLGLKPGQDFRFVEKTEITNVSQQIYKAREDGPFDEIESHTPIIPGKRVKEHSKKQKLLLPLYENPIPIIFTEGKTDWKHLKAAFLRFKSSGYLEDLQMEFKEFGDELQMGDEKLRRMCEDYAHDKIRSHKTIFIFDRDNKKILSDVSEEGKNFKNWGNNVFSFAIPIPSHRKTTPEISLELFYLDEDIKRSDAFGRRLFLSNEFRPVSSRHKSLDLVCKDLNKLIGTVKIVDNLIFNENDQNVALPKNDFASNILNNEKNFSNLDIGEFTKIFDIIIEIMRVS